MKKILVVDDEEMFRVMIVTALKRDGYETLEADNGLSAFEMANEHTPALIISDVMMYSGSGFILHEFLKKEPRTSHIPLILMSGQALDAGAWGSDPDVEYFEKPFSISELLSAVRRKVRDE